MGYHGKPSGSCHACRERKTKCDKVPEGCTQCHRTKRKCPGYRSPGDMMFRDESTNVVRKFKARESRAKEAELKAVSLLATSDDAHLDEAIELVTQANDELSIFSLSTPIEDLATGFFVSNFLMGVSPSGGHLIVELCQKDVDDSVLCSMKAIGFAGYSQAVHAPSLLMNARYQYIQAIQATNRALRDPVDVKKDSTLLSIFLLGTFEAVTGCKQRSLKDWSEHIKGAAGVMRLRGPEQIFTYHGLRMVTSVASYLSIPCIQRGVALPQHIRELIITAMNVYHPPSATLVVRNVMMRYIDLNAEIASKSLTDGPEIISRALELDGILLQIHIDPPTGWEYDTIFTDENIDCVYNGRYHIYADYWAGEMWNTLRCIRILLHETIRSILLNGFLSKPPIFTRAEHTAQLQISTDTLCKMQEEILYSVPQHLGCYPKHREGTSFLQHITLVKLKELQMRFAKTAMAGGLFLLWPLWLAGIADVASEPIKEFAIKNLRHVADTMGIQQANALADVLVSKTEITVWRENEKETKGMLESLAK